MNLHFLLNILNVKGSFLLSMLSVLIIQFPALWQSLFMKWTDRSTYVRLNIDNSPKSIVLPAFNKTK
ncbi:hypothetical protein XELAEV_18039340mg [Xenopus laevis]|uniref:Uncharacterized protein n=1 Tax=Xenopus laevis TaxID=8355 RepID=A0A974H7T7_XENLA|nr:hypothetical protein XELAEV_18039340mg [Xenopus laevis]